MSALSFLSKKSWHTGLQQNQEAVWKAEKSALEERRKLDELRKERDREREIQELERLQEEAGGKKKRVEKVDWMYNAPASGSNIDKNELEDYLLGKKRVDKLLKADEGLQHSRGNQEGPISEQKAIGSDRDVAAKIREDPMFAIKQQEQAAYQALLKDPARLRAMKKAAGMDTETKEERRRRKEEKKRRRREEEEELGRDSRRDRPESSSSRRDAVPDYDRRDRYDDRRGERRYEEHGRGRYHDRGDSRRSSSRDREQYRSSGRSNDDQRRGERNDSDRGHRSYARREEPYDVDRRSQSRREDYPPSSSSRYDSQRQGAPSTRPRSRSRSPVPRRAAASDEAMEAERQAKLAAMQQNASALTSSRSEYLAKIQKEEEENSRREEELRLRLQKSKEKGYGEGKGSFLIKQQKDLYGSGGMDLNQRLQRSREGLQRFNGD